MSVFPDNYLLTIVELIVGSGTAIFATAYLFPGQYRSRWAPIETKQKFVIGFGFLIGAAAVEFVWRIGTALLR